MWLDVLEGAASCEQYIIPMTLIFQKLSLAG
jgi:hypothetical protein